MKKKLYSVLLISLLTVVVAVSGCSDSEKSQSNANEKGPQKSENSSTEQLIWNASEDGFSASSEPPQCPDDPLLESPVDLNKVVSILYPGQTRGGNYKAHGGFRFDTSSEVAVNAPIDGFVFRGARYIEQGEVQYLFDIMNNCGILIRFDHILELSPEFQKIVESWPEAKENDSRTQPIDPPVYIEEGDSIGTDVGFRKSGNIAVDFGVYDYRSENEASQNQSYRQTHEQFRALAYYGVCWFDLLSQSEEELVRSLPAGDGQMGTTSDYCSS